MISTPIYKALAAEYAERAAAPELFAPIADQLDAEQAGQPHAVLQPGDAPAEEPGTAEETPAPGDAERDWFTPVHPHEDERVPIASPVLA